MQGLIGLPTLIAGILLWVLTTGGWHTVGVVLTLLSGGLILAAVIATGLVILAIRTHRW